MWVWGGVPLGSSAYPGTYQVGCEVGLMTGMGLAAGGGDIFTLPAFFSSQDAADATNRAVPAFEVGGGVGWGGVCEGMVMII